MTQRGRPGGGYSLFLQRKGGRGHVAKRWSKILETNGRIRWCVIERWRWEAVLELRWLSWPLEMVAGCDSRVGEGSRFSPRGAAAPRGAASAQRRELPPRGLAALQLRRVGKWPPLNYRLIPQLVSAGLGLSRSRGLVTAWGEIPDLWSAL